MVSETSAMLRSNGSDDARSATRCDVRDWWHRYWRCGWGKSTSRIAVRLGPLPRSESEVGVFAPGAPLDILSERRDLSLSHAKEESLVPNKSVSLLQGSLDILVLKTLSWGPLHGFGIARWIQRTTDDALQLEEGSLYPALYRMENRGWLTAEWAITENNRRAKYYRLSPAGRKQLAAETAEWKRFTAAVGKVLQSINQPA